VTAWSPCKAAGDSPPESRDGEGRTAHETRGATAAAALRRARPESGGSPAGERGLGLGAAMMEKREAKSTRSSTWEGIKRGS
jgi:hypothetical protein